MTQSLFQGVETEKCPSMSEAMKNEEPVNVSIRSTLADGLAVLTVGYNAFATIKSKVDKLVSCQSDLSGALNFTTRANGLN